MTTESSEQPVEVEADRMCSCAQPSATVTIGHRWVICDTCMGYIRRVDPHERKQVLVDIVRGVLEDKRNGKIDAIKALRAHTGWGLKEAKDFVEEVMPPPVEPELPKLPQSLLIQPPRPPVLTVQEMQAEAHLMEIDRLIHDTYRQTGRRPRYILLDDQSWMTITSGYRHSSANRFPMAAVGLNVHSGDPEIFGIPVLFVRNRQDTIDVVP